MPKKKVTDDATVLEKALLAISHYGPERFTLTQIGKAVDLAPATLLQRFGSKGNLLKLAAKQAYTKLASDLQLLQKKQLPWDEELSLLLCDMPDGFGSRQDIANSLAMLKLDMIDPELHPIARKLFTLLRERIQALLIQAQTKALISSSIDPEAMAWELDALRHGLVIQWSLSGKGKLQSWMKKSLQSYLKRYRQ